MITKSLTRRLLWTAVIVLVLIGVAAVTRRALTLTGVIPAVGPPFAPDFDAGFGHQPLLTFVHILPGALYLVLGAVQFAPGIRARHLNLHRWSGRVLMVLGLVIGVTGLIMGFALAIGGANESAAITVFATIFLFALCKAYVHVRRREIARHREWMIRAYAIGLAVATIRPIVAMFFALSNLSPHEFFGIAFWIGFTAHLIAAECWINYTKTSGGQTERPPESWAATATYRFSSTPPTARPD